MTLPDFFEGTEMPDPAWWEALWPERVIRELGIAPDMTVVDLCSGDGWFIDIDGKLLEMARYGWPKRPYQLRVH